MSKFIWIGKDRVSVSEELYKEYYKMKRRQRYFEHDIKVGRIKVDQEEEKVTFVDSKEDSIQRLTDLGSDFVDDQLVEDVICDKATLLILQEAMADLNQEEQDLIQSIYYQNQTTRDIAKKKVSRNLPLLNGTKKCWIS